MWKPAQTSLVLGETFLGQEFPTHKFPVFQIQRRPVQGWGLYNLSHHRTSCPTASRQIHHLGQGSERLPDGLRYINRSKVILKLRALEFCLIKKKGNLKEGFFYFAKIFLECPGGIGLQCEDAGGIRDSFSRFPPCTPPGVSP